MHVGYGGGLQDEDGFAWSWGLRGLRGLRGLWECRVCCRVHCVKFWRPDESQ